MNGRIEAGFRGRFRMLLALASREGVDPEIAELMREGRARAARDGMPLARALAGVYDRARVALEKQTAQMSRTPPWSRFTEGRAPRFLCDPSLGGLARWLRAAGYEAMLVPEVPGHRLPEEALARGLVLLTTEAEVLDRRIVADETLLVVWLPSALSMREQLRMVMRDLGLRLRAPRCMACGGVQVGAPKESVRPRIPPRTALWKDEYFVCAACDKLFWQGTHWERIARALAEAAAP